MDSERTLHPKRQNRLRAAWRAYWGVDPSIVTVMAEWAEYELIFTDILTRLSAQLARQAKLEKRKIDKHLAAEAPHPVVQTALPTTKQALRSQAAVQMYGSRIGELLARKQSNGGEQDESSRQTEARADTVE